MIKPHLVINRNDGPYLERWMLFPKNRFFNIYLHKFIEDDEKVALHSHPFWACSIILKGKYKEIRIGDEKIYSAGSIRMFGPDFYHRVELIDGPVWTLFIRFMSLKDWYFLCPKGPVSHKDVIKIREKSKHEGLQCPD